MHVNDITKDIYDSISNLKCDYFDLYLLHRDDEEMFNENNTYHSSTSYPMKEHFKKTAEKLLSEYNPINVMEIGSNDGIFIRHFNPDTTFAVEPCGNFADITNDME